MKAQMTQMTMSVTEAHAARKVRVRLTLALVLPLTVAAAFPAAASLTPFQQLPFDQPRLTSVQPGPSAAMLERRLFQAPPPPAVGKRAVPCTVQTVLFDKSRLAQSCY